MPTALIFTTGAVINAASEAFNGAGRLPSGMLLGLIAYGTVFVIMEALAVIPVAIGRPLTLSLDAEIQLRVVSARTRAPLPTAESEQFRSLAVRALRSGSWTPGGVVLALGRISSEFLMAIGALLLIAGDSPLIALCLGASVAIVSGPVRRATLQLIREGTIITRETQKSAYTMHLATSPSAAKEIRLFGLANWLADRFLREWDEAYRKIWKARPGLVTRTIGLAMVPLAVSAVAIWYVTQGATGFNSAGAVVVLVLATAQLMRLTLFSTSYESLAAGFQCLDALAELEEQAIPVRGGTKSAAGKPANEIVFRDVSFRYPGRDEDALHRINLSIPAGRSLGVVGENGAGKTTLIKLLCALYEPTSGYISIDGERLQEINHAEWYGRLSAIFQDFGKWPLSARDNIAIGNIQRAGSSLEAIEESGVRAGIAADISALPRGWDTPLSRQLEGGVDLSGGQWQRIAWARAMFGAASKGGVLILDEPTAQLDARAEAEFYRSFLEMSRGLTTVLVSHRFSTVRWADRIIVLGQGRILEAGSHSELVAQGGLYNDMFRAQAGAFSR